MDDEDYGQEQEGSESEEEDLDHDEIILGNATDLIISLAKAYGDSFMPYMQRLGPLLVTYLTDEHPRSDKLMIIGCMAEVMAASPILINSYFDDFFQVILKHCTSDDSQMNRNCAYGIGILAEKCHEKFPQHLQTALSAIKTMHTNSEDKDAKDNCIASIVRILETYGSSMDVNEYNTLFTQIMSSIPLMGDPTENPTIIKFAMTNLMSGRLEPHMTKLAMTCLNILTDARCRDLDDDAKLLTAKFLRDVVYNDESAR